MDRSIENYLHFKFYHTWWVILAQMVGDVGIKRIFSGKKYVRNLQH